MCIRIILIFFFFFILNFSFYSVYSQEIMDVKIEWEKPGEVEILGEKIKIPSIKDQNFDFNVALKQQNYSWPKKGKKEIILVFN